MEIEKNFFNITETMTLLSPKQKDVLLFHIKTDEKGDYLLELSEVCKTFDFIKETLELLGYKSVVAVVPDKFYLGSLKDANETIERLKNIIAYIEEVKPDIQENKFGDGKAFIVNMKDGLIEVYN